MLMTLNSRAEFVLVAFLACGCVSVRGSQVTTVASEAVPPDAPQERIDEPREQARRYRVNYARIELFSVRVRRIDDQLRRFAGSEFLRASRDPVAVEATTAIDLPMPIGAGSPVLIINGEVYVDTWFLQPNRLVAFVADRAALRASNIAEAMWIGGGDATRSTRPLPFPPTVE